MITRSSVIWRLDNVKASVTPCSPKQKNRVEEVADEEDTSQHEGYRDLGGADTTVAKDQC